MDRMGSELAPSNPRSIAVLCVASEVHECIEEGAESEGIKCLGNGGPGRGHSKSKGPGAGSVRYFKGPTVGLDRGLGSQGRRG